MEIAPFILFNVEHQIKQPGIEGQTLNGIDISHIDLATRSYLEQLIKHSLGHDEVSFLAGTHADTTWTIPTFGRSST